MGQRKSKFSKTSYDVAPVVSGDDFNFKRGSRQEETISSVETIIVEPEPEPETTQTALHFAPIPVEEVFDTRMVPAWVNEDNFIDMLRENVENFDKIVYFKAYSAMKPGENYATLMVRVKIDVALKDNSVKKLSFMLKVAHDSDQMKQMLEMVNFFTSENNMYFNVVPELESLYKEAGVNISFGANAYKLEKPGEYNVLLEDLCPHGFKNANRLECLDMEHTKIVLQKLSQYHAASAHRVATKGSYPEILETGGFGDNSYEMLDTMLASFKKMFLEHLNSFKDGEVYYDAVQKCFAKLTDDFMENAKCNHNEFNVLNHGDCWSNNILFKYDDNGRVQDMKFVDFQMCKYGVPVQDLYYFIITSVRVDIKLKYFDYFIRFYHENLVENLKILNYPKKLPTLRELHVQLFNHSVFAIFPTILTLPVVLLDVTENAHFDNFMAETEASVTFKNQMYTNKVYVTYINEILPWLYNRGLFEPSEFDCVKNEASQKTETQLIGEILTNCEPDVIEGASQETETQLNGEILTNCEPDVIEEPSQETETQLNGEIVTNVEQDVKEEHNIPDWVNEDLFFDILKKNIEDFKEIKSFSVSPGSKPGENYMSTLLKINIDIELNDGSISPVAYMLKFEINSGQAKIMSDFFEAFKKEIIMYDEILPKLEKAYKDVGVDIVIGPRSYKVTKDTDCKTILMTNLQSLDFKNANRLEGLDMEHTKCALAKLAEFHAASACIFATGAEIPEEFTKQIYTEEMRKTMEPMNKLIIGTFKECATQFDNSEQYAEKLKNAADIFFEIIQREFEVNHNQFNVLNHGDCWTNNIMYQYDDEGKVKATYFVDFQMPRYGSPAQDLYYFLLSSASLDIKLEHFDYFINFYHTNLKKNLELLKYPKEIPTVKELHVDLIKHCAWAYYTTITVMSAVLLDPSDKANIENLLTDGNFQKQLYLNPRYRRHADAIFLWLNNRGLLDFSLEQTITEKAQSVVPNWANESYFSEVLEDNLKDFSKISNLKITPATKPGDNYASLLLRVEIEAELKNGSKEDISFLLKLEAPSDSTQEFTSMWNFFEKEKKLYEEHIPEFEQMYKDAGLNIKFAPKYYKCRKDVGCETLLLEDLKPRGFKNADRIMGLDIDHTKCVLRKLAQLHAASARRVELKGVYAEVFNDSIYNEKSRDMFELISKPMNETYLECINKYEGCDDFKHKIPHMTNMLIDKCIELSKVDPSEFNVLNHGDSWLNNIMFQYDDAGNINETYYVDFQVGKYGPPAVDLYYFLMSSTHLEIKVDQFDYLIKYYHDNLKEHLELLKYSGKIPTLKELHISLIKYGFLAFATIMGVATICLLESTEHAAFDTFIADTPEGLKFRYQLYGSDRYTAHSKTVLSWLNKRGLLDF